MSTPIPPPPKKNLQPTASYIGVAFNGNFNINFNDNINGDCVAGACPKPPLPMVNP
ncbi:MAG: hypothetical protein R2828_34775 [Saprospiraceae bacterium]